VISLSVSAVGFVIAIVCPDNNVPATAVFVIHPALIAARVSGSISPSLNLKANSSPLLNLFSSSLSKVTFVDSLFDSTIAPRYAHILVSDAVLGQ
jgi:hypothetical protein